MRSRGCGTRNAIANCPTCGAVCGATDTSADAHRVWAQRHADSTGHTAQVMTRAVRAYHPRSTP